MTLTAITAEAKQAGLNVANLSVPSMSVAGQAIDGPRAHAFAGYMRIHALEATGGLTYAQMPRYASTDGKGNERSCQGCKGQRPATGQRGALGVGDRDGARHGAPVELHGQPAGAVRDRHRDRTAADRDRFAVLAAGGVLRNRESPIAFAHGRETSTDQAVVA